MRCGLTTRPSGSTVLRMGIALVAAGLTGCGKTKSAPLPTSSPAPKTGAQIDFPPEMHADDPTVNAFISAAIATCVAEDYEAFRLLWSAREKPITEREFRRGWRATRKVTILNLRKLRLPTGEIVYGVYGRVELDPAEVPKPQRKIVLLLLEENDKWRIAKAPPAVQKLLTGGVDTDAESDDAGSNGATPPAENTP